MKNKEKNTIDPLNIPNCNFSCLDGLYGEETVKAKKLLEKYQKQRIRRGFDDTECWNLDRTIAAFILPRIKVFRDSTIAYPGVEPFDTFEKWQEGIDKMIYAFDHIVNEEKYDDERSKKYGITWNDYFSSKFLEDGSFEIVKTENYPEEAMKLYDEDKMKEYEQIQEGLDLLGKYFLDLYW